MLFTTILRATLVSSVLAQNGFGYNNSGGWQGSYSAGIVVAIVVLIFLLFSCCTINRRRRYARQQNPAVKPPMFGTAPPAYSLPFFNRQETQPAPPYNPQSTGSYNATAGAPQQDPSESYNASASAQYPPPPARTTSSGAPPPAYGKVVNDHANTQTGSFAPPPGPPPPAEAHIAPENGHFVGGFRQSS